jgi:hypothetical protein
MRDERTPSTEDSLEIRRPVQAFDAASAAKRLRQEKTYEDHGRSVLSLFHGPSLRAMLTAFAAGSRTGERRVAGPSTVHVLEGKVKFQAGEERHVLSAGGTLVLEGKRALRGGGPERRCFPAHAAAAGRRDKPPATGAPDGARRGARRSGSSGG